VTSYSDFFSGSATIAGALVGLLFVSLSIQPERNRARGSVEHRAVAGTAFVALIDALFISLIGLEPGGGLQLGATIFGLIGLFSSCGLAFRLWRARQKAALSRRWALFMLFIIAVYAGQLATGLIPENPASAAGNTATFIYILFALGIARAWELLGMQGQSIIREIRGTLAHADRQPPPDQPDGPASGDPPAAS
jgi:hypothetical protein